MKTKRVECRYKVAFAERSPKATPESWKVVFVDSEEANSIRQAARVAKDKLPKRRRYRLVFCVREVKNGCGWKVEGCNHSLDEMKKFPVSGKKLGSAGV